MTEEELRELDMQVFKALYPGWRIERREGLYGPDYRAILPGDGPNTWVKDIPLPWYSADIRDWEDVYALKPGWDWYHERLHYDGEPYEDVCLSVKTERGYHGYAAQVAPSEATGLAAYALGRARCVLAWAEAQR